MLITQENKKNKKITKFLLSLFLICFSSFIHGQVYIQQGATVFVEKNTVITENLSNAISVPGDVSSQHSEKTSTIQQKSRDDKTSVIKRRKTKPAKKDTLELSQKRKQQVPKKQKYKPASLGFLFKNSSDESFILAGSAEKPILFPDHHLKWEIPETVNTFYNIYFVEKNKSFYTSTHPLIRTSKSFRTRPPPFSLF